MKSRLFFTLIRVNLFFSCHKREVNTLFRGEEGTMYIVYFDVKIDFAPFMLYSSRKAKLSMVGIAKQVCSYWIISRCHLSTSLLAIFGLSPMSVVTFLLQCYMILAI